MPKALTATPWLAVLDRIIKHADDDTTRTLARMLYAIILEADDTHTAMILDHYAAQLLGGLNDG
jgi:hypothetical protein